MFVRTVRSRTSLLTDLAIALVPVLIWAGFLFGGRAIALPLLCGLCCALLELPAQFVCRLFRRHPVCKTVVSRTEVGFAFLTGVLCALWFPVTVPLWLPMLASLPIAVLRCVYGAYGHRLFNSAICSALLMQLSFPEYMERFTKPFAYFPLFPITPDAALVEAYRVRTPLGILQDGMLYEDGTLAQFYGYASGAIGTVAVLCLLLGGVWLLARRLLSLYATGSYLLTVLVLSMAFAPDDAEMIRYSLLYLFCGGIFLVAIFGMNDPSTLPRTAFGKAGFGVLAGILTVLFRNTLGGCGELYAFALCPLVTPLLEKLTRRPDLPHRKRKRRPLKAMEQA